MDGLHGAQIARSRQQQEQLAKEWLLRLIERTPLPEVGELPVPWIVSEAPSLIAAIVRALEAPAGTGDRELAEEEWARAAKLVRLREGPDAAQQIPRDLAALQSLLVDCLRRELPQRNPAEFARAVERLTEIFGSIQGAVTGSLLDERAAEPAADELTGLPGPAQLDEWLRVLLAEYERYGHGFALALIDVDGLGRINDAFGHEAGDRLISAIATVIRRQVRATDPAFRLEEDEFAVLAPHSDAGGLVAMALRVAELIDGSQADEGPRIAVAAGVVACPADGTTAERLLEAAAEATYAAKAAGKPVATSPASSPTVTRDR